MWRSVQTKTTTLLILSRFFFFFVSLFFNCLEKQNKSSQMTHYCQSTACLCADRSLIFKYFFQYSWEYANEGASHSIVEWVMWPEQWGLRARWVGRLQRHRRGGWVGGGWMGVFFSGGTIPTCPHLLWERATLCIMETDQWAFFVVLFFSFHKLKHSNTTLTHLPAS